MAIWVSVRDSVVTMLGKSDTMSGMRETTGRARACVEIQLCKLPGNLCETLHKEHHGKVEDVFKTGKGLDHSAFSFSCTVVI